VPVKLHL
jgi:cobalamin biosynthesis protein CobW